MTLGARSLPPPARTEFLICGSANDAFYSQIAFFRLSLDRIGPQGRAARVVAAIGAEDRASLPDRWRPLFARIEVHYAPPDDVRSRGSFAASDLRFELVDDDAGVTCLCDADTALVRPLPETLVAELTRDGAIGGVVAHYPFPIHRDSRGEREGGLFPGMPHELAWQRLGEIFLGRPPDRPLEYTLLEGSGDNRCPFYPNYGFLAGPPQSMRRLYRCMSEIQPAISRLLGNDFSGQVAIALAVEKAGLAWRALPMRYNFPNDRTADRLYPEELSQIVLLHYLRDSTFDRHRIFADPRAFEHFLWLPLEGSDRVFQDHVLALTEGGYFGARQSDAGGAPGSEPREPKADGRGSAAVRSDAARPGKGPPRRAGRQLVIAGMHRSGTSLTAGLLRRAGLDIGDSLAPGNPGNPRGYFEDPDFRDFHDDVLAASGYTCFTATGRLTPAADSVFHQRARSLLAARAERPLWGWKDPRTCLFLEFWDELLPEASYLFVYRHPVDVALSLFRRDTDPEIARDPWLAVRSWELYNRCVLELCDRLPERCFLAEVPALTRDLAGFVRRVAAKLDLTLAVEDSSQIFFPAELAVRTDGLDGAWRAVIPEALALYDQLVKRADLAGSGAVEPQVERRDHGDSSRQLRALQGASESLLLAVLESSARGAGPLARKLELDAARLREQDVLLLEGEAARRAEHENRRVLEAVLSGERRRLSDLTSLVGQLAAALAEEQSRATAEHREWMNQRALDRDRQRLASREIADLGARCEALAQVLTAIEGSRSFSVVRAWWRFRHRLALAWRRGKRPPALASPPGSPSTPRAQAVNNAFELIIVCGGRRSGTTLLAAMLCSDERSNPLGQEAQILTRTVEAYRWGRLHFDEFGRSMFGNLERYRELFASAAGTLLERVAEEISPGRALVLKNPELSLVLRDVADLLPAATLVATVRDPRDQVASELEVGARRRAAGLADPVSERRDVAALANSYVAYYAEILALHRSSPGRVRILRYEDLIQRPVETLELLRDATGLGLPFDPERPWARVSHLAALHEGPSQSDLYGGPLDRRSIGRFRRDLSDDETAVVEAHAGELLREFGYDESVEAR